MANGVALAQKAGARRERIAIFGGKKSVIGRRTQKGKIFNRRNRPKPKPKPKPAPRVDQASGASPARAGGSGLIDFGDDDDDGGGDDDGGDDGGDDDGGGGSGGEG